MAHKQKYYKSIESNGHIWKLEIWQDTEQNFEPIEIGSVLQSLKLSMQGDQSDVDTPIVKTSLQMSFVDAPDLETERKCGYWEEFFTSSATEYLVKLYKDGTLEWTGFITPDSFEEDLCYRGSISIIARDNLGYMQDFMFRLHTSDGLVTIKEMLNEAKSCVGFQMDIVDAWLFPQFANANRDLREVRFNVSAFRDKSYWEAIETALYSLGLTLRYIGKNSFLLAPIREQSKCGYDEYANMPHKDVRFVSYGHREIVPSAKAIMETAEFDILESLVDIYAPDYQYTDEDSLTFVETSQGAKVSEYSMPVNGYDSESAGVASATASASRLLNPYVHKLKQGGIDKNQQAIRSDAVLYALCNTIDIIEYEDEQTGIITLDQQFKKTHPVVFASKVQQACTLEFAFTFERPVVLYADGTIGDFIESEYGERLFLSAVGFKGTWAGYNGVKKYFYHPTLQGGWSDTDPGFVVTVPSGASTWFTQSVTVTLPSLVVDGPGELRIEFYGGYFDTTVNRNSTGSLGAYIRITDVKIMATPETPIVVAEKTKVTTSYSDQNNLLLKREPEYAPNPNLPLAPQMIVNNMMMSEGNLMVGALDWIWHQGEESLQLPVLIHQQLLCYYARPMNLLSGELIGTNGETPDFSSLWLWKGKEHMLTSGTLNILTGHMESASLREFVRYEKMWEGEALETYVENPDIYLEYTPYGLTFIVHTNKTLTYESWNGEIPYWIAPRDPVYNAGNDTWECKVTVYPNTTGEVRVAQFKIDTADVRITQGYNENQ